MRTRLDIYSPLLPARLTLLRALLSVRRRIHQQPEKPRRRREHRPRHPPPTPRAHSLLNPHDRSCERQSHKDVRRAGCWFDDGTPRYSLIGKVQTTSIFPAGRAGASAVIVPAPIEQMRRREASRYKSNYPSGPFHHTIVFPPFHVPVIYPAAPCALEP
jgi:hypothetical protein